MNLNIGLLCMLLALSLAPATAAIEAPGSATTRPSGREQAPRDFRKGQWTLQLYPSYMHDVSNRELQTATATVGVGYYVFDNVALNLELAGGAFDEPGAQGATGSMGLLMRQHLFNGDRWSFYIDVGGGISESERAIPVHGTRFNLWMHTGPGITCKLADNLHLMTGVRYYHLSNAQSDGNDRNPSGNGVEVYTGLMFTF